MAWLQFAIPIIGVVLCLLAGLQLAFWAAQSWSLNNQNQKQFELAKELLRQQLDSHNAKQANTSTQVVSTENHSRTDANFTSAVKVGMDGSWKGFRKFKIVQAIQEAAGIRSLYLTPTDEQAIADFRAGQHLTFRFNIPGQAKPVVRCYSLSNGPGQGIYRISVKAIPARPSLPNCPPGIASNFVNHELQVGAELDVKAPSGKFVLDTQSRVPAVLLAGGIGVTPMISMIEQALRDQPKRLVVLLYGVKNRPEQAFRKWLDEKSQQHGNLMVVNCFSSPLANEIQGTDFQVPGYVSIDLLKQLLPNNQCQFYLCGPAPFMDSMLAGLADWDVPETQIFAEAFGPAASASKRSGSVPPSEMSGRAQVSFAKSAVSFAWNDQYDSLLELAESNGVEMESGCRAGSCGTCATRLLNGKVSYRGDEAEHEPGECLTCIAIPDGDLELDV